MAIDLYSSRGFAEAYIEEKAQNSIYLHSGEVVAYIEEDCVYTWRGQHIGFYENGVMYDIRGLMVGFTKETCPAPKTFAPEKELKKFKPPKGQKELRKYKPVLTQSTSQLMLSTFLKNR